MRSQEASRIESLMAAAYSLKSFLQAANAGGYVITSTASSRFFPSVYIPPSPSPLHVENATKFLHKLKQGNTLYANEKQKNSGKPIAITKHSKRWRVNGLKSGKKNWTTNILKNWSKGLKSTSSLNWEIHLLTR